jgi:hypothetical protein
MGCLVHRQIRTILLLFLVVFSLLPGRRVHAQKQQTHDAPRTTGEKIAVHAPPHLFYTRSELTNLTSSIRYIESGHLYPDQGTYLDSLRAKAARTAVGQRLYNLAVVEPEKQQMQGRWNRDDFSAYSGLNINNIVYIRLDPFGTNINDPELKTDKKEIEFLNKTHIRSSEAIIRRYLLFNEGDTISELTLGETERNLRRLQFINDARILVNPLSESDAEVVVITRDSYSTGADISNSHPTKWEASISERNLAGTGHSIELGFPFVERGQNRPGIRVGYNINNIAGTFANLELFLKSVPGERYYGFSLLRDFVSAESDFAGGVTLKEMLTRPDVEAAFTEPANLEFTYQDYWLARAFLIDRYSLSRIIFGVRYIHNNVYSRPEIEPLSYYDMQKYRLWLGSLTFSRQHFSRENFIYNYGRTEDVPYGILASVTAGREINEFKTRNYAGAGFSFGNAPGRFGYLNLSVSGSAFFNSNATEQGGVELSLDYFTPLITGGYWKMRGFARISHTYGFDRYNDEFLTISRDDIITGFRNDSIRGRQRSVLNLETVAFSPVKLYGFRFAFFTFADIAYLGKGIDLIPGTAAIQGIGAGVRIRNDNLVISTFQLRLTWYPTIPPYSDRQSFRVSGESPLRLKGFDAGPPSIVVFR